MMKKIIFILLLSFALPLSVTFQVDMQEQFVSDNGIHLAGADTLTLSTFGTYQDSVLAPWTPEQLTMEDIDFDGVYSITLELEENTVYAYKFINGFEYELDDLDDRYLATGTEDLVLDVACFDKASEACQDVDNSLVQVVFIVDMQQEIVSENGVGLLGTNPEFTNFGFDVGTGLPNDPYDPSTLSLVEIEEDVYSITLLLEPGVSYSYKFVNGNDWGGVEVADRSVSVSEVTGYILNETCFGANEDCPEFTTLIENLTFKTDVSNAITNNGFELGDTLIVRWGYGETQAIERQDTLSLLPFSYTYKIDIDSVNVSQEAGLYYQYYKLLENNDLREIFFNFSYLGEDVVLAERRFFPFNELSDFTDIMIDDTQDSNVDDRRMPIFLNTDPIGIETQVTWTVDLSPAYYQIMAGDTLYDIQGMANVYDVDSLLTWGVWMNGPASMPANGETWSQWGLGLQGTTSKKMWDDGTHGDVVADDRVYTLQLLYDETAQVGQEFKFGIKGGDNESSYGLNHYENINVQDPNIHVYFGSINPIFYNAWDFDLNEPVETEQCVSMDLNNDGAVNVVDVISVVNIIIGTITPTDVQQCAADINQDDTVNVVDVISIVNQIINS